MNDIFFKSKFRGYLFEVQFTQYGKNYKIKTVAKNDHIARQRVKIHYPYSHVYNITCMNVITG